MALSTKSDENIAGIVDLKFKPLLEITEASYDLVKNILDMQNKYFLRFMNVVSLRRMPGLQEKVGWNRFMAMIKHDMISHAKSKLINKLIENLSSTSEGSVRVMRRKAFNFINSGLVDHEGKSTIFG